MRNRTKKKSLSLSWLAPFREKLQKQKVFRLVALVLAVSYVLSVLISIFVTQSGIIFDSPPTPELGAVAGDDVVVDHDVYYVDEEATEIRREARAKLVPPVFELNEEIAERSVASLGRFREIFFEIDGHADRPQANLDRILTKIQYEFPMIIGKIRKEELSLLLSVGNPQEVFERADVLLEEAMWNGVASFQNLRERKPELFTSGTVEIRSRGLEKEEVGLDEVITRGSLESWANEKLAGFNLSEVEKSLVVLLVSILAEENLFFDEEATEAKRKRARDDVEDVVRKLVKGQVIVRKGDIIDQDDLTRIRAIGESTVTLNINTIAGTALFLGMVYLLSFFLFSRSIFGISFSLNQVFFLTGMALTYLVVTVLLTRIPWQSQWIPSSVLIPTAVFAILVSLIISTRIGIIFTVVLSLLTMLIARLDLFTFLFALLSGVAGCAVVSGAERRIDLIRAGAWLSVFDVVAILMLGFLSNIQSISFLEALGWGIANGFSCGILSLGFLPLLEHMMNAPTRFRLMELSDLNSPVFKKMLSLAPGTYNHSIMVANLAESACTRIGANALLARVGGYYHDIGKIDQAKYFIENQKEMNLHDDLKPSLSAAVIKSHVKVGIEKAKEIGLPKEVIDIISQHHGRALISYFYQRALDTDKNEKRGKISSDDYSYTGEWPKTKEAVVIMLADAAEAASRTLKSPTIGKLEKFIWSIIMDKFNSGELNRSNLTFNDLEEIKNTFVHVLAGYFHSRIEYPNQKEPRDEKMQKEEAV